MSPVVQCPGNIQLRQVKVFGQLPKLTAAVMKGTAKILLGQEVLGAPSVGTVFAALYQLIGAVHLVQSAGGSMSQFVTAYTPQQSGGAQLGKIQEYGVMLPVPDGCAGLRTAGVWDNIHLLGSAVLVKIRNLKHFSFAFHA